MAFIKKRKAFFSKITISFLLVCFLFLGVVSPQKAQAQFVVSDPTTWGTALVDMGLKAARFAFWKADDIIKALREKFGIQMYNQILSNALQQIAYDMATYWGEGGKGKEPQFISEGWGEYMTNIADNAAGEFIEGVSQEAFGDEFNLCEPDLSVKVLIGLGLTQPKLETHDCTFTKMKENWNQEVLQNKEFLSDFQNYFDMGGDIGMTVSLNNQKQAIIKSKEDEANLNALIDKGWKADQDLISGKKTGIPQGQEKDADAVVKGQMTRFMHATGDAFVDAANVFTNQYFITLFQRKLRELGSDKPKSTQPYQGDATSMLEGLLNPNADPNAGDNEVINSSLVELVVPNFNTSGDLNILSELAICPDPAKAGPSNCVISSNFSSAISESLTVGQALKKGYLREDGKFGFIVDVIDGNYACYGNEPSYEEGYPYRSMLILRKYRILSVGWELAAQYIHDYPQVTHGCTLGDVVACYEDTDEYVYESDSCNQGSWCRGLVDPNWVLTVPEHTCKRSGPGPNLLFYQSTKGGSGLDGELIIQRDEYCADEQSCIYEKRDGVCEQYGYCVEEKRKWDFGNESCDPLYNSCETFRDDEGDSFSFLENTVDNATCSADNVGCLAYCEDYSLDTSSTPMFTLEQSGRTYSLPATYQTPQNAASFYNYFASSFNQPLMYPMIEEDKSVLFIQYDTASEIFNLGIFHDYPNSIFYAGCELLSCSTLAVDCDCDGGSATFTFDDISSGNQVAVEDDPGEAGGITAGTEITPGMTWTWGWGACCTDGGMVEMPADNWSVTINPNSTFVGLNRWVLAYDGGEIPLDMSAPVTISKNVMSGNFDCLAGGGDTLYLDRDVQECDEDDAGCQEFIRIKNGLGTNLVQNSGFEDNIVGDSAAVVAGAYDVVGDPSIAWNIFGSGSGATASVYGLSAGQVHSGEKSLLIESDDGGIYSYDGMTAGNNFPIDFDMEIGKAYTLSAWVYVETGGATIAIGRNTGTWETLDSTTTGEWERMILTVVNDAGLDANEFYIYANVAGSRFYVDDIQFEENLGASSYKAYRQANLIYEKILPSYLDDECYRIPGVDYRYRDNHPAICNNYARLCTEDEVGCELYTSVNTDISVPANVTINDYCTAECVGYDEYLQLETVFTSLEPKYFIPKGGKVCDAGSVGCEEFTNLDETAGGGEEKEYYSYLRQCVKPGEAGSNCGEFYTWEGSSETGFQLKVHNLQIDDDTDDVTYPNPEARYVGDPAVTSYDYDECNELIYNLNLNSDCREFYNRAGGISYHLYSRTLTCSENCHPFRMTKNNVAKDPVTGANISWATCQLLSQFSDERDIITNTEFTARGGECVFCKNGGVWDSDSSSCIYKAIPEEGTLCSAAVNGCREYSGSDGNRVFNVFITNFEGDVQGWSGVGGTTIITDNESLRINEEALRVQNAPFTISKEVGTSVQKGKSYYLEFLAKNISASQFNSIYLTNGVDIAEFYTAPNMTLAIGGNYAVYKMNLSVLGHDVADVESLVIEADGDFFIDDIKLVEITDRYYLIDGSWVTPDSCFEDIYGNPVGHEVNLGCDQYVDRADNSHYLHNFPMLCQESAVGCEVMIDTHNYSEYGEGVFNLGDPSEELVPADNIIFAVYEEEKECESGLKGCQILGKPYNYGNFSIYREGYWINNPDDYARILCRDDEKECREWSGREGFSYFKDPADQTCEYRLESDSGATPGTTRRWDWFKTKVMRCDGDSNGEVGIVDNICLENMDCAETGLSCVTDADCGNDFDTCESGVCRYSCTKDQNDYECPTTQNATIGSGGEGSRVDTPTVDGDYNNWVGICSASDATCTEYVDPISNFSVNLLGNAGFSDLASVVYNADWYCSEDDTRTCSVDIDCTAFVAGDCVNNIWRRSGGTYTQTVSLQKDYMYRLGARNDTPGSTISITCPSLVEFNETQNNFGVVGPGFTINLANAGVMYSKMFYIQNDMDCVVEMNNVATGAGDYAEVKEIVVEYQLEYGIDKESCNGIVNPNEGCVLFNEREVTHKSLSNIDYAELDYDADETQPGGPTGCSGSDCSANVILKVTPDRACDKWLACTNMIEAGSGEESVCEAVGICDKLDKNGECDRFVAAVDTTYTYDPVIRGVYNPGDIQNMSGYVKVGYMGTKINDDITRKSDNKLNFGSMTPYGGQAQILNGSFEFATENEAIDNPGDYNDPTDNGTPDWGDLDYPVNWRCSPADSIKCEVIDDPIENEEELICYSYDRDGTCRLYAPDGKKYLKLIADHSGSATITSSDFDIDADTDYLLSFMINTIKINQGRASIMIIERDDTGAQTNSWPRLVDYHLDWRNEIIPFRTGPSASTLQIVLTIVERPQGNAYFDSFFIKEALTSRDSAPDVIDIYETKECRLYPRDNSFSCDYYEDGIRYKGWTGYCLEHDRYPGWENACLQWWSIPHSVDSINAWCGDEEVGDDEDCECSRDAFGNEVRNCQSESGLPGTTVDNSYECVECTWHGGWCGDNYTDTAALVPEECDWNDDTSVDPDGSEPQTNGITCENLPFAWDWAGRTDLDPYRRSMFTDGNLGCFSHDGGENFSGSNNDRCTFDTSYSVGSYVGVDPTPASIQHVLPDGFGCTSDLFDDDLSVTTNLVHTAQECIAAGGEVVSDIVRQPAPDDVFTGAVVINTSGETIRSEQDFGNTFCKLGPAGGLGPWTQDDLTTVCALIGDGTWRPFLTGGEPWTTTSSCHDHESCSCSSDLNANSGSHSVFQNLAAEYDRERNSNCHLTASGCRTGVAECYADYVEIGCY